MTDFFSWPLAMASVVGVVLNIHHRRLCFFVWGLTNASWAWIDFAHGVPAQGVLQVVYCGLSVWGWAKWKKGGQP